MREGSCGHVRTTTETCSLMQLHKVGGAETWVGQCELEIVHTYELFVPVLSQLPYITPVSMSVCVYVCVTRVWFPRYDDECASVSRWEDSGGRGSPRDSHPALPGAPEGRGDLHQPHR